ncbi:protein FAM124B isoform X2 [Elephas maximus indicus]|nr:protein FAM124B isoform X2 [Elephas maximus indicus]XP_049744282.1 protein FAM124B isoform X2 [Elephas maximus indicus]XP_049744283.1 protein FAM124B isoform X2 [Elephas maximus indicus]
MGERQEPLAMTVHLLANSGHGSLLQRTLDQLLDGICPEVRLFLVSERVSPVKSYEKYHSKRSRFPGMSVLLFLHESLGEERIFHILDSLQHSPWQCYPTQNTHGRLCPSLLANEEFYSLDNQMPVWGVRQVHCGTEILRVTLYCSFDNYEDAIRLYEMILQKEATSQKSNFCFFVLYSTATFALQLCLKQLPLGMSVDPKESSVLQFKVQEIGQLVPLLPNPCIPISSTRWQTQDYDGNKILLQVQMHPGLGVRNAELSSLNGASGADTLLQGSRLAPVSTKRSLEPRSRRSRIRSSKVDSPELLEPGGSLTSDSFSGTSWKSPSWSPSVGSPAMGTRLHLPSPHFDSGVRIEDLSQRNRLQKLEAEMNVDTGFTVVNSEPRQSSLSRFPRDMQTSQPPSCLPAASLVAAASKNNRAFEERVLSLSLPGQRDLGTRKRISKCPLHWPVQKEEKEGGEEEFFI